MTNTGAATRVCTVQLRDGGNAEWEEWCSRDSLSERQPVPFCSSLQSWASCAGGWVVWRWWGGVGGRLGCGTAPLLPAPLSQASPSPSSPGHSPSPATLASSAQFEQIYLKFSWEMGSGLLQRHCWKWSHHRRLFLFTTSGIWISSQFNLFLYSVFNTLSLQTL